MAMYLSISSALSSSAGDMSQLVAGMRILNACCSFIIETWRSSIIVERFRTTLYLNYGATGSSWPCAGLCLSNAPKSVCQPLYDNANSTISPDSVLG